MKFEMRVTSEGLCELWWNSRPVASFNSPAGAPVGHFAESFNTAVSGGQMDKAKADEAFDDLKAQIDDSLSEFMDTLFEDAK